ncbi:putative 28S rRNA (cytosine-C(5))-methyltransferase [Datura stramonium]|uniref:28S rRNA (Cytosine-C(5))-methyltransferase n=1 Tax=Datura stramonium TaxID=4076 RepID=A0ABS8TH04_DATST|nr:putative 28S rRNA (cytosine-C(5))-methyltransferase [Datura stramonium]
MLRLPFRIRAKSGVPWLAGRQRWWFVGRWLSSESSFVQEREEQKTKEEWKGAGRETLTTEETRKYRVETGEFKIAVVNSPTNLLKPRYARVNTLKMDVESALLEFKKQYDEVCQDAMVPDLLIFPPRTDLHDHPLVKSGSVFLQGKASCMVAVALGPKPRWEVIDACAAPGNKTVHLAALMKGNGKIIACELNKERVKRLKDTVKLAGATNVKVKHEDFLNMSPEDPVYSKVQAILLDPSCSGSGTAIDRLDHLLPSFTADSDVNRLEKLAAFQRKALEHALSFPAVERIVYSTCSINQVENEDVIKSVLPLASSYGFELTTIFPQWPRRGHPIFDGSQHVLRTDLIEDKEGFFIALFVRKGVRPPAKHTRDVGNTLRALQRRKKRKINSFFLIRTMGLFLKS